jgi:hypothetical protein
MAEPNPVEVAPWYLRNITQALELNETTGQVFVRTNSNIDIGNANISVGNVGINSFGNVDISGNTLPVTIDNANIEVTQGTSPWVVSGNVTSTLSGNLAGITGNVTIVDGGGAITVDGTVNIGTMPNVNAEVSGNVGITGNVNIGTMPNVNASISGNVSTTIVGTNLDAFGRLRVSNPVTLFDSQNRYLDGQQFSQILTGSGTRTYVQDESSFNLTVGTGATDSVVVQSKTVQAYQPGKSLLVMNTFAMAAMQSNLIQKVGYFTEQNGIYFEQSDALYFRIKSFASGSSTIDSAYQPNWNGDTLDGSGGPNNPSGILLDPTLVQIFWCDIEWLGVGNVRCGFVINGQFIVCHTFQHANMPGNTTVYMTTATLNPRYEIYKTGAGTGGTMKQICSTVISEGGYSPSTSIGYVTNGTSVTRVNSANTVTSLCSIRLNPAYPDAVVIPAQIDLLLLDVRYGQFQLIENATIANAVFSNVANSVVQSAIHTDTITDGTVVYAGLNSSRDEVEIGDDIKKRLQLWRYANGTPSTLTLAVAYTATNADLLYKLGWEELTN